jgi:hypothetical protein
MTCSYRGEKILTSLVGEHQARTLSRHRVLPEHWQFQLIANSGLHWSRLWEQLGRQELPRRPG